AQKFLAELTAASDGAEVSVHQGDVGCGDDCKRTIREVIDRHGRLDILVNNAGITIDKTVAKMTEDEWNKVIAVNLSGAFFLAQAALAHMLERGSGRIVMVSSVIGEMGAIGQANYAASKAGLFGLTKTLAREACFHKGRAGKLTENGVGVTVNAITPGYVATEMIETIPDKVLDRIKGSFPMRRLAQPWEIARVVHFLAADASGYITGQIWGVNGFGDGAAAIVLGVAAEGSPPDIEYMQTYASGPVSQVNSILWPNPAFANNVTVFGPEVKALAGRYLRQMLDDIRALPDPDGVAESLLASIELIVPHQANKTMVIDLATAAGLSPDQLYFNIERVGNASSASIPLAIDDAVRDGVISAPTRVFAPGFGAGAVAGYAILRIDPAVMAPDLQAESTGESAVDPESHTVTAGADMALAFG